MILAVKETGPKSGNGSNEAGSLKMGKKSRNRMTKNPEDEKHTRKTVEKAHQETQPAGNHRERRDKETQGKQTRVGQNNLEGRDQREEVQVRTRHKK